METVARTPRYSTNGELLNSGEYELKNGRFKCRFRDADGNRRTYNASTLEELRKRKKKNGEKSAHLSPAGEPLNIGESAYNGAYFFRYWDENAGKERKVQRSSLSELREVEEKIKAGDIPPHHPKNSIRYSSKGEPLNTGEAELQNGRFSYSYVDQNGKRKCTMAVTLEKLRIKEENIRTGHPELNRVRYSSKGELLRECEYERKGGGYAHGERTKKGRIEVYADTLKELRKKVRNIKAGHPERNEIHKSSKGETLYKGEREGQDGRYYCTWWDAEANANRCVSANTLEKARERKKNIEEGHLERNHIRYSAAGEILREGEVEDKRNGGFHGRFLDKTKNEKVHTHAPTLPILRERKERIEQGMPAIVYETRYTSTGEVLNKNECEDQFGRFHFAYKIESENRWTTITADTLEELRWMEGNIAKRHPEWNNPNYTKDGQRLFANEARLMNDRVWSDIEVNGNKVTLIADTLDGLRDAKSTLLMGAQRLETREGRYTVYEYFDLFFQEKRTEVRFHTYASYVDLIDRYLRDSALGNTFLNEVKRPQVREFVNGVAKKIRENSPSRKGTPTANSICFLLSQLFEYAEEDDLVDGNPAGNIKVTDDEQMQYQKPERRALTVDEQKRLYHHIKGKYYEPHILMLLCTGIRCAELLGLTWDDVDFQKNKIYIRKNLISFTFKDERYIYTSTPKTKAGERSIPLTKLLREILQTVKERCKPCAFKASGYSNFIFTDEKGELLTNSKLNSIIKKYVKEANKNKENSEDQDIPDFSCHWLRYTYLTDLAFQLHLDPSITKALAGHASIVTTMNIYETIQPEMLEEAGERVCAYFEWLFGKRERTEEAAQDIKVGETSAIASAIMTAKSLGANMEQTIAHVGKMFNLDAAIAADIINGFWAQATVGV